MRRELRISLVIPCHDEEEGIRNLVPRIPPDVDEVVVVDNNCTDRTAEVARSLGARVIAERRPGYGAAYQAGLAAATGDLIVTMDGDGTYPPEAIPRLVDELLDRGWDFLSASRLPLDDPRAMPPTNRAGNLILTWAVALLFFAGIRDSQSGMWVFHRALLPRLRLTSSGMAFSQEIKLEAIARGASFGESHISYGFREGEVKLRKWRDGFANLGHLLRRRLGLPR
jgi:glycosyltransferase involved in cell wall biosynthesis